MNLKVLPDAHLEALVAVAIIELEERRARKAQATPAHRRRLPLEATLAAGGPIPGAQAVIRDARTGELATVYADGEHGTHLAQPIDLPAEVYVGAGEYALEVSAPGVKPERRILSASDFA